MRKESFKMIQPGKNKKMDAAEAEAEEDSGSRQQQRAAAAVTERTAAIRHTRFGFVGVQVAELQQASRHNGQQANLAHRTGAGKSGTPDSRQITHTSHSRQSMHIRQQAKQAHQTAGRRKKIGSRSSGRASPARAKKGQAEECQKRSSEPRPRLVESFLDWWD
jgi:hypothetical protein